MFLTFFVISIAYFQPISSQELQIIELLPSNNIGRIYPSNLIPLNKLGCKCQSCQGQKNLLPSNPCGCRKVQNIVTTNNIGCECQKQLNLLPRNIIGCGCQAQNNLIPQNYGICTCNKQNVITKKCIGCRCQGQNNLLPINNIGCDCQSQNTLILPSICGCKKQHLVPLRNIWYENQRPNNLILVNDITFPGRLPSNIIPPNSCGCKRIQVPRNIGYGSQGSNGLIPSNYIGCIKCKRQNITPNNNGCVCQRQPNIFSMQERLISSQIPNMPIEKDITLSNSFSITDLPITMLPNKLSERISTGNILRHDNWFNLKDRLAAMTDLVSATANLVSKLTKTNDVNTFKRENVSITDMPVTGNDEC